MTWLMGLIRFLFRLDDGQTQLWKTGGGWGKSVSYHTHDDLFVTPDDDPECRAAGHRFELWDHTHVKCEVCEKIVKIPREPRF